MLKAEQELRVQDRGKTDTQGCELQERRVEIRDLARRRLATRLRRKTVITSAKDAKKKMRESLKRIPLRRLSESEGRGVGHD
jgi:hypothetical protein